MIGEGEETFRELFCLCRRALADGGTIGGNPGKTEGLVCRQGEDRSNRTEGTAGHEQPSVFVPSAGEIPKQNHLL